MTNRGPGHSDRSGLDRRVYRGLLNVLPAPFRTRFGPEMEELFLVRVEEAESRLGLAVVWLRAVGDVVHIGASEWTRELGRTTGAWVRGGKVDSWVQDLRYAIRTLQRAPASTILVVSTLALAIGSSTATFSVVDGVLFEPLPYEEPDRLVAVWPEQNFNAAMVRELLASAPALESGTGIAGWTLTLTGEGDPLQLDGARVSPGHFQVLGVRPTLGRTFTEEEGLPGNDAVAVLSHGLWVRVFGSDPEILGRTIELASNDHPRRTVVGVLPPDFRPVRGEPDVWIPVPLDPSVGVSADPTWYINDRVARLAPGATVEQATAQVRAFAREMRAEMDQTIEPSSVELAGVRPLQTATVGDLGPVLWVALGAVSLVLLIACANVANLLLARGETRRGDLAVRAALGAGRERIARLLLLESGLMGLAGGALGMGLSFSLVQALLSLAPSDFPRPDEISVDGRVLFFGLVTTVLATVIAGLIPALRTSRPPGSGSLAGSGRSASGRNSSRLAGTLVGLEIALALVVVVGSGLMLRSWVQLTSEDSGIEGHGVLAFRPNPPGNRYTDGAAFHAYYTQVLERVRSLPAVERASAIHLIPGTMNNWSFPTFVEGDEIARGRVIPSVNFRMVWPEYFETVGIELTEGRTLEPSDGSDAERVVVVNQAFVNRFWPDADALGREIRVLDTESAPYRVVGIVEDVRQLALSIAPLPEMYFTHAQIGWNAAFWVVARMRDGSPPLAHAGALRDAVWSVDPDVPITGMEELVVVVGRSASTTRVLTILLGAFGALALLLSAVGVFGVTAYRVGRRTAEFGVRIALGASRAEVLRAAVAGSVTAVALGLVAGLVSASLSSRALAPALYEIEPSDPVTFAAVALLLLVAATAASLVPAWRATRVDPVTALKTE